MTKNKTQILDILLKTYVFSFLKALLQATQKSSSAKSSSSSSSSIYCVSGSVANKSER